MNVNKIVNQLNKTYPGKKIIKNRSSNTTEIICEIDPTEQHQDYSVAVAIIDQSIPHFHKVTTEEYEVMKGILKVYLNNKLHMLKKGDKITIKPNTIHHAIGQETWIKTYSKPGWKFEDHILVEG